MPKRDKNLVATSTASESSSSLSTSSKVELKREVSFIGGVNLIVGTIIGSGIFISPKGVFENAGSIGLGLVIWFGCGMFGTLGALCYAELGTMIPKSGGEYPILLEAFGPVPAYLFAWTATIITKPASLSLLSLTFARYVLVPIFGGCDEPPELALKLVAAVLILSIIYVNCMSVKVTTTLMNLLGFGKMISLVVIIIAGIVRLAQGYTQNLQKPFEPKTIPGLREVTLAFYQGLWAVDGWNQLNYVIDELKNPTKNLPRAIITSMGIVTTLYVATNVAYFTTLSFDEVLVSKAVAVSFGNVALGVMVWIIPVSIASSVVGTCLAVCFTGGRISHVAAKNNHFSPILAMVHVKNFTPAPSVILNGTVAILMLIPNDFDSLIQYYGFATVAYYSATCIALLWFRYKRSDWPRPVKVPIFIPIIFVLMTFCLMLFPIVDNPEIQYLFAILSILIGLVFYIPFVHYNVRSRSLERLSEFLQTLMRVSYPEK